MKKLLVLLVVVALLVTAFGTALPASANNDKVALYEAALIWNSPTGPVLSGEVTVYDDFQAKVEIQDPAASGATYDVSIHYGYSWERVIIPLGPVMLDENGNGEEWFDLTWLPDSPPPPGAPEPPLDSPRRIIGPEFIAVRPNPEPGPPPGIILRTSFILPTTAVKRDLVEFGTGPEWNVVGSLVHKVVDGNKLIVDVKVDVAQWNPVNNDVMVAVYYSQPSQPPPVPGDAGQYFANALNADVHGNGVARVEVDIAPTGDSIWVYVSVREEPMPPPPTPFIPPAYTNKPPPTPVPF